MILYLLVFARAASQSFYSILRGPFLELQRNNGIKNRKTTFSLSWISTSSGYPLYLPEFSSVFQSRKQKGNSSERQNKGWRGVPVSRFVFTRSRANQKCVSLHPPPVDVCHNILILNRVTGSHALA